MPPRFRVAQAGAVLLRNEGGILPFGPNVRSIAVIGAQAGSRAVAATPGSAYIPPTKLVTGIDGIRVRAGAIPVSYSAGSLPIASLNDVPSDVLRSPDGSAGLRAEYVGNNNLTFDNQPRIATRIEPGISVRTADPVPGLPANNGWSVRWTGKITPRKTGVHVFSIVGAGSARLMIAGKMVTRFDRVDFGTVRMVDVQLEAGRPVDVELVWTPREAVPTAARDMMGTALGLQMRWGWAEPDSSIADAVSTARKADVAVVFAANSFGEGADRDTLALPGDQNRLIAAVAAANPNTVVVLNTSGAVTMPWADKVKGIIEMWYPGDVLGVATAGLLFGDAAPGGRLPLTFPMDDSQGPATAAPNYPGTLGPAGELENAYFDEGLKTGYRWFDATGQKPLYPFGFGLTYSPITLSDFNADRTSARLALTNKGQRADSEVIQIYVAFPASAGEPPKRLAAFSKVQLAPGERKVVTVPVPPEAFLVWDEQSKRWTVPAGRYEVLIARSSRNILYRTSLTIH